MTKASRRLRFRLQRRAILLLALFWVLLWGEASLINIVCGLVLGWLVSVVFWLTPIHYYGRVHPFRLLVLILATLKDLAVASIRLTITAFSPRLRLKPGIIRVELHSDNDLYQVAVAELISIVPGTLVVDIVRDPRLLYLHVFDLPDSAAIAAERHHAEIIERRLVRAVGSKAEIERVCS